jgi:hypothetical protein
VSWDGQINCSEAVITGGSLTIGEGFTTKEDGDGNIIYEGSGFSVDSEGNLICNNAIIQGKLINSELDRPNITNVTFDGSSLSWITEELPTELELEMQPFNFVVGGIYSGDVVVTLPESLGGG